jgi:hypothetical protein
MRLVEDIRKKPHVSKLYIKFTNFKGLCDIVHIDG